MPFGACQFLHYAKFMHFDAFQHFSLLKLIWNISYYIFFCDGLNVKNILFFYRNIYKGLNVKN